MSVKQISVFGVAWLLTVISLSGATDAPLADAAEIMDGKSIRALLQQSFGKPHYALDVNASQVDGMTALHWAAHHDNLEIAQLLVRSGATVNAANRYGVTPLSLACTNGNGAMVYLLLDAGADPNTTLPGGETALMTAARTGRLGPIKALLSRGADVHGTVHGMGRQEGAGANAFIARMADSTIFDFQTKAAQTALMWATAEGHAEVVEELIKAGAEYKAPLASGFTPLLFAVREGHMKVVQTLVKSGADINQTIDSHPDWQHPGYDARLRPGSSPLHMAVENGHFELAAYLIEAGANPNAADPTGYTALHAISTARKVALGDANPPPKPTGNMTSLEFINKLAAHGANLNARMKKGQRNWDSRQFKTWPGTTPFLLAVQTADIELMKTLTKLGANPLVRNENNKTALMLAGGTTGTEEEVVQTMQLALNLGVEIDAIDENGETAMHAAAYKNRPEVIMFLADKGARIEVWNRKNKFGVTPLAIAVGHRKPRGFRPQPKSEAAIREVMIAAGLTPPTTFNFPDTPPVY